MIVSFVTEAGAKYHIDHTNKQWVQESPEVRSGPLFNQPQVIKGKKVEIWTADANRPVRVIITTRVVEREVTLEAESSETSSAERPEVHQPQALLGDGGTTGSTAVAGA